jgi:hypothetical protein
VWETGKQSKTLLPTLSLVAELLDRRKFIGVCMHIHGLCLDDQLEKLSNRPYKGGRNIRLFSCVGHGRNYIQFPMFEHQNLGPNQRRDGQNHKITRIVVDLFTPFNSFYEIF